jgi:hypothetical protein
MTVQTFRDLLRAWPFRRAISRARAFEVRPREMARVLPTDLVVGDGAAEAPSPAEFRIGSFPHVTTAEGQQALA